MEDVDRRLLPFRGTVPQIAEDVFVADTARVIGDVVIEGGASVWFGAVIRGDVEPIRIGKNTNIQDLTMVHVTHGGGPAIIGDGVTVGHRAVIHGCTIHDVCLIGIGAVVLDGAEIGSGSIVAAGAVVAPGTRIPERVLFRGVPARFGRDLSDEDLESIRNSALGYCRLKEDYRV
jgi:gamma-carbonic anhydrase